MTKTFIEKEEALRRYNQMVAARFPAIIAFLFTSLILRIFFNVSFPNILFFLVSFMAISTIIYDFFFRQIKDPKTFQTINGYFGYLCFDVITLTIIIYVLGGIAWIGFIFYGLYVYIGFLLFPRSYSIFFIFYCSFLYTLLVITQHLEIFPYQTIFSPEERIPQNLYYVLATWMGTIIFLLVLGYYGDVFYKILQGKIEELQKTKRLLEEARTSLGIRVRARTKELLEARESLEGKVEGRTEELEEERKKLAKRITELERFHRVAVGRELKMRTLKKEIDGLKEKLLKKIPNR